MTFPTGSEKSDRVITARGLLFAAILRATAGRFENPGVYAIDLDGVDSAAREYVEALDAPETCWTCGQAKPC